MLRDKKVTLGGRHPSGRGAGRVAGDGMDLETVSWCPERTVFNLHTWAALQEHFVFFATVPPQRQKPGEAVFTLDLTARSLEFCGRRGGWVEAPG